MSHEPHHVHAPVSAAILAGGRARRLGGLDKASLVIGGSRIIDRQLAVLGAIASHMLIVANEPSRYADLPVPVVPDAIAGAGALGGIYTALTASPAGLVVVVACDLPFITREFIARLVAEATDDVDAVVPRAGRGLEPLCAIYSTKCAGAIRAQIERGALRASTLPPELRVRELGPDALAPYDRGGLLFVNVNTPHDYARARAGSGLNSEPCEDRITE